MRLIEERLGRFTATTLLALLALALAVVCLNVIITRGILPAVELVSKLLWYDGTVIR